MKDLAIAAAKEAGNILVDNFGRIERVDTKGVRELVSNVDVAAENKIIEVIKAKYPDHGILCEESEEEVTDSDYKWIIDPLDGTTNFAHGYPCFCVSIGLMIEGAIKVGVVFDPFTGELFSAVKGKGAFRNGNRISVSKTQILDRSLLVTGFPYDIREGGINNVGLFNHLIMKAVQPASGTGTSVIRPKIGCSVS